jgi:hypothetical protein
LLATVFHQNLNFGLTRLWHPETACAANQQNGNEQKKETLEQKSAAQKPTYKADAQEQS